MVAGSSKESDSALLDANDSVGTETRAAALEAVVVATLELPTHTSSFGGVRWYGVGHGRARLAHTLGGEGGVCRRAGGETGASPPITGRSWRGDMVETDGRKDERKTRADIRFVERCC